MYADWMVIQISYLQITLLGEAGSDCSSCIVLFDPLPALSLCLLHDIDTCSACISPLIKKNIESNKLLINIFSIIAL